MHNHSLHLCFLLAVAGTVSAQQHVWHAEYDASDDRGDYWGGLQGGVTYAPGVQGMAFSFDGTDDMIRLSRPALPPPWTLSAWVRRADSPTSSASLLQDDATAVKLEQWPATRKLGLTKFGVADYNFDYTLPAGRWAHITLTASASTTTLYVDGAPAGELPVAVNLPMGWIGGGAADRLKGEVDEMYVWNTALSASEVFDLSRWVFQAPPRRREWSTPVKDASGATLSLTRNGEPLGFRMGAGAPYSFGLPFFSNSHYQGIARWEKAGSVPYMFLGRSGYDIGQGNIVVVEMGSRGRDGERMRSNRLAKGLSVNSTPPPASDRVVRNLMVSYKHVGSLQIVGDVLAVALEDPVDDNSGLPDGRVMFFDISDPLNPLALPVHINTESHNIGVVGMTRLPDGHFLVVVTWGSNDQLEFYRSNGTSFFEPGFSFSLHDTWYPSEITGGDMPSGAGSNFQSLSLFNQEDGAVYMIGSRNESASAPVFNDRDVMTLYRINGWHTGGTVSIAAVTGVLHKDCSIDGAALPGTRGGTAEMNGNFLAAAGHYVSPAGELLYYSSEYWNDGPGGCLRFVEFHHDLVARPGGPLHYPQAHAGGTYRVTEGSSITLSGALSQPVRVKPWVELYDDDYFTGRSVMVDWDDYFLEDYQDLRDFPFNDKTSSVRWHAPPGYSVVLYDADNYRVETNEPYLALGSTGWYSSISNLSDSPWEFDNLTSSLHETRVTSLRFTGPSGTAPRVGQPMSYAWQVPAADQPGVAMVSSPSQVQPVVKGMDGPRIAVLPLTVSQTGPYGTFTSSVSALVEVVNAEPEITSLKTEVVPGTNGRRARARISYHDAGLQDSLTLTINWGDGVTETFFRGTNQTDFSTEHTYADNDPALPLETFFTVTATVTDDDGGSMVDTEPFRVVWRTNASTDDGDGDGLPDYWEDARFNTRSRTGAEDTDGDGRTNLDEYRAGTDPRNAGDAHNLEFQTAPDGSRFVSFTARGISGSGYGTLTRRYRLEYTKDLAAGGWQAVPGYSSITGAGQTVTYTVPAQGRMFLRSIVWLE